MEAPDKIYVNFPFGEEHPWRGPMVTKQGLNRHDTTYIRKDALLEWAKNLKERWEEPPMSRHSPGCVFMLEQVINKLNSM